MSATHSMAGWLVGLTIRVPERQLTGTSRITDSVVPGDNRIHCQLTGGNPTTVILICSRLRRLGLIAVTCPPSASSLWLNCGTGSQPIGKQVDWTTTESTRWNCWWVAEKTHHCKHSRTRHAVTLIRFWNDNFSCTVSAIIVVFSTHNCIAVNYQKRTFDFHKVGNG